MSSLEGRRVALLEARMSEEAATLVRRLGGTPDVVPAVREGVGPVRVVLFLVFLFSADQSRWPSPGNTASRYTSQPRSRTPHESFSTRCPRWTSRARWWPWFTTVKDRKH